MPWSDLEAITEAKDNHRNPTRVKPGRKQGKTFNTPMKQAIIELHRLGYSQSQIVRETRVSKGYVSRVIKQLKSGDIMHGQGIVMSVPMNKTNNNMEGVNYG